MHLRPLLVLLPLVLAGPAMAQGGDGLRFDLSFSGLAAGDDSLTGATAVLDGGLSFGRYGLQLNAETQMLDGAADIAATSWRIILRRDIGERLRLGLSAGMADGDDPAAGYLSLGLHARYDAPAFRIGGDLVKPTDDRATDGALVVTMWAEQDLRPDLTLRGELYRRSTDTEEQDIAAALIGLSREFSGDLYGFGQLYTTNADDHAYYNQGARVGAGWHLGDRYDIYAALDAKAGTGIDAVGLTVGLRMTWGDGDRLFVSGPLPDLVGYGTY